MYSISHVREKSKRENYEKNRRLNFFAVRASVFFTWAFVNVGISPNYVTLLFFLTGLCSAVLIIGQSTLFVVLAYILYRIHLVLDVSDGEVARFTQKFSRNGAYWDFLTHSLVYPLFFGNMGLAQYSRYHDSDFVVLAVLGAISIGFFDAVKNDYYRALFLNDVLRKDYLSKTNDRSSIIERVHPIFFSWLTFEGLLVLYLTSHFMGSKVFSKSVLGMYVLLFFAMAGLKAYLLSARGTYPKRN